MEGEEEVSTFETRRKPVVATSLKMAVPLSVNHKKILPLRGAITFQGDGEGRGRGELWQFFNSVIKGRSSSSCIPSLFSLSLRE